MYIYICCRAYSSSCSWRSRNNRKTFVRTRDSLMRLPLSAFGCPMTVTIPIEWVNKTQITIINRTIGEIGRYRCLVFLSFSFVTFNLSRQSSSLKLFILSHCDFKFVKCKHLFSSHFTLVCSVYFHFSVHEKMKELKTIVFVMTLFTTSVVADRIVIKPTTFFYNIVIVICYN